MTNTTKMKSFVKGFVALVKGDDAEATAQKVLRLADSALKTHIANLKGDLITKEDAVTAAHENLAKARINNGTIIADRTRYVNGLLTAKNDVAMAEEELTNLTDKIEFLETELDALDTEVDA